LPGTIAPTSPLTTVPGKTYQIDFFHSSSFNSPQFEAAAFLQVLWNGNIIGQLSGYSVWQYHSFTATGTGSDLLSFHGGAAPAYDFIDDIYVFEA
jgi:phage-related tail fiber protein